MGARRFLWLTLLLAGGCATEKANGRPWIRDLRIEGVKSVQKKDLKSRIALEGTSWIPLSPKRYLDPFEVDLDRKRIVAYYAAHGYFFARVTEAEVEPVKGGKAVDIRLVVDEGPADQDRRAHGRRARRDRPQGAGPPAQAGAQVQEGRHLRSRPVSRAEGLHRGAPAEARLRLGRRRRRGRRRSRRPHRRPDLQGRARTQSDLRRRLRPRLRGDRSATSSSCTRTSSGASRSIRK